ncbi:potassium transporter Kup [Dermacoccus abyssi]|uniref:potassium transporter Kup n=1 Tax=Dermacoccus abyssi TaxID=322596 RepID=UPI002AD2E2B3|nr:potassium transporter Kup [Dermacoccus abyssi]
MTSSNGSASVTAETDERAGGHRKKGAGALVLGALGVVFGDIGTSPLYSVQSVFNASHNAVIANEADIYGTISWMFWSLTIIVTIKYVLFVLRADNDGEGGIMALAALVRQGVPKGGKRWSVVMLLGVIGASLFFGDSVITPAISVMSAVEGLEVVRPGLNRYVVPIGAVIITILFLVQRKGTEVVGKFFGPIMILWFVTIAALGIGQIVRDPHILKAFLPNYATLFVVEHPFIAFIAAGSIVLCVTGAEALYADMGHFGRAPITRAWFLLVFPSLVLNYMGQGSLILTNPDKIANPFFLLAPEWAKLPLVILATMATVIASQAVISGAFSVARQAERSGYLPRMTVRHTGQEEEGQIYIPGVNWVLFIGVMLLLFAFRSSEKLAVAYGLAVTGTFLMTTTLFLVYAHSTLKWRTWRIVTLGVALYLFEGIFFLANVAKLLHGGWLPVVIALGIGMSMLTWQKGRAIVATRRQSIEGPLATFVETARSGDLREVPGTAVFLHPDKDTTPLALRENANFNHVIHENVFIVSTLSANVPHVAPQDTVILDQLGNDYDRITHLTLKYGFQDDQDVPAALRIAKEQGVDIDPDTAYYFVSEIGLLDTGRPGMNKLRKLLFIAMTHNAAVPADYFRLPKERTVMMGAQILL